MKIKVTHIQNVTKELDIETPAFYTYCGKYYMLCDDGTVIQCYSGTSYDTINFLAPANALYDAEIRDALKGQKCTSAEFFDECKGVTEKAKSYLDKLLLNQ